MVIATIAVAIALVFTRTLVVLIAALVVAVFWGVVVIGTDPMTRWRVGDDPGVSEHERWRDADL